MKHLKRPFLIFAVALGLSAMTCNAQSGGDEKICEVHSVSMNRICKEWDGQWQGMAVASDGNCYFSSSTHSASHGAGFHRFNPETKEHTMLAEDLTITCNEGNTLSQQGKVHSPVVEHNGWLYFNTHLSNYWPEGIERYTGAHVVGYEMATGKFRDFGVIRPRYSTYSAIGVDPVRNKLYTFVVPFAEGLAKADGCHLYSIDIATGDKEDLGLVVKGQSAASFWFFVDHEGNCWFTLWKAHSKPPNDNGNLYVYRPSDGKIHTYHDVLPEGQLIDGTPVSEEQNKRQAWTWAGALPGNRQCLFTMGRTGGGDERLWKFDPSKDIASGEAFQPIAAIGSTFLQTALGGNRLYFVQYTSLEDERTVSAEASRDKDPDVAGYNESLHLRSVSINPEEGNTITDHGKIVDQDGRAARMVNSMAADDKGRVYMYGSFYVKSYKEASFQILFDKFPGENIYKLMKRGEFFSVAYTD